MSDARAPRPDAARRSTAVVVGAASALAAVVLAGRGLLLPAGGASTLLRFGGACTALVAAGLLVRLDGPLDGARSLAVVSVAGLVVGVATLPWSPVTLGSPTPDEDSPAQVDDRPDRVILDGAAPGEVTGALLLPEGASPTLERGQVVLRFPDGSGVVAGAAAPMVGGAHGSADAPGGATPGTAEGSGPSGDPVVVTVVDGVPSRSDGAPIGGDTPLAGLTLQAVDGERVFVGDGVLLPVPDPLAPDATGDQTTDGVDVVLAVLLMAFAIVAFAPPVVRLADRVVGDAFDDAPSVADEPSQPTGVEAGVADVLRSMLVDPDPRTAVIGAYARLLAALAEVGFARRDEETPHEHLWRCLGPLGVRRAPVHRLAELFVRARFTPTPVTELHRRAAIAALADTVADLALRASDVDAAAADTRRSHEVHA